MSTICREVLQLSNTSRKVLNLSAHFQVKPLSCLKHPIFILFLKHGRTKLVFQKNFFSLLVATILLCFKVIINHSFRLSVRVASFTRYFCPFAIPVTSLKFPKLIIVNDNTWKINIKKTQHFVNNQLVLTTSYFQSYQHLFCILLICLCVLIFIVQ